MSPLRLTIRTRESDHDRIGRISREEGYTDLRLPRINWGRGRLVRFTSQGSFAAQFCALNNLTARQFRTFIEKFGGVGSPHTFTSVSNRNAKVIAELLDEPCAIVRTMCADIVQLPSCSGQLSEFGNNWRKGYVSYCPACVADGYHASFHEALWLYRCPIHATPLERYQFRGGFDRYIESLTNIFSANLRNWPQFDCDKIRQNTRSSNRLRKLKGWMERLRKIDEQIRMNGTSSFLSMSYQFEHIGLLLGRLNARITIPAEVYEILLVRPIRQDIEARQIDGKASRALLEILKTISLNELIYVYIKTSAFFEKNRKFRERAISAIEAIRKLHQNCLCSWAWQSSWMWFPVTHGRLDAFVCPYAYAIEELISEWVSFAWPSSKPRRPIWDYSFYKFRVEDLPKSRLARYLDYDVPNENVSFSNCRFVMPDLRIGECVEDAIDSYLVEEVESHYQDLFSWLESIKSDKMPQRLTWPTGVSFFYWEEILSVISWRLVDKPNFSEPELRWQEGVRFGGLPKRRTVWDVERPPQLSQL